MTEVSNRISPALVHINGQPCTRAKAAKFSTCAHSKKKIRPGDLVYRQIGNSNERKLRWLASEIEVLEAVIDVDNAAIAGALAHIDRTRERLKKAYERDMAKLDSDERILLGMKPK